ncbi:MAG: response regulator [Promethearchaeota archaeon]
MSRMKVKIVLNSPQWDLLVARDGIEAYDIIRRESPDLVVLDIQIPGIDGLEVVRKVREEDGNRDTIFLAVTAYAMKGDEEKILAAGCDGYVSKPIDTRALPRRVKELLGLGDVSPSLSGEQDFFGGT